MAIHPPLVLALCLDGVDDEALVRAAKPWFARFERIEVWCGYGDAAARELAHLRERHGRPPAPPPPPHRERDDPDREAAEAIAQKGVALLRSEGSEATSRIFGGADPGHALAEASTPDVALFLSSGHRGGIGPKSIGHVARFIVDHAGGPVILVKL